MIGRALRMDLEQWVSRIDENALFRTTKEGALTPDMLARYLGSLRYMLTLTPIHLRRARERALEQGDQELAAFFQEKLEEEVGHDAWADNDLRVLAEAKQRAFASDVMPSAKAYGAYLDAAVEENPALWLAYAAFQEYITVVLGPKWIGMLVERCDIPRDAISVIDKHVELDREHAEENFAVLDDFVRDPKLLPRMREAMAACAALFDAYTGEAVGAVSPAPTESGVTLIADAEVTNKHVSAA